MFIDVNIKKIHIFYLYMVKQSILGNIRIFASHFTRTILLRLFVARVDCRYCFRCCATSCKSQSLKPEKPPNWVILFFLSPTTSGSGAARGRRKILNPPRSLRIWREPVRKQRRGVDYDDRGSNVRGGVHVSPNGRAVSRMYCTPKRDP